MGRMKVGLESLEIVHTVTGWHLNIANSVWHGTVERVVRWRIGPITRQFAFQNCK